MGDDENNVLYELALKNGRPFAIIVLVPRMPPHLVSLPMGSETETPISIALDALRTIGLKRAHYTPVGFDDVVTFEVDPDMSFFEFDRRWVEFISERSRLRLTSPSVRRWLRN